MDGEQKLVRRILLVLLLPKKWDGGLTMIRSTSSQFLLQENHGLLCGLIMHVTKCSRSLLCRTLMLTLWLLPTILRDRRLRSKKRQVNLLFQKHLNMMKEAVLLVMLKALENLLRLAMVIAV